MKNSNSILINATQDSIPQAAAGTGTITQALGNTMIVGAGTSFLTEADIDDWIYIKGQNEFRKITVITSDTVLYVDQGFTLALTASAFHITPASRYKEISFLVTGASAATVDGVSYAQNESVDYNKAGQTGSFANHYVDPIDIDASSSTVKVTVLS